LVLKCRQFMRMKLKNPGYSYPRAILYSTIIIMSSLILASLAIAIVVPHKDLSVYTGLLQALKIFLTTLNIPWMLPVVTILIIFGGIGSVATWIIGPTKGLLVAALDGNAPKVLSMVNDKGVPVAILILQACVFTLMCSVFVLMPTVSSSYWVLTAITAQLAMLVYIGLFASALYLRYKRPEVKREYKIPLGNIGMWLTCIVGVLSCITAIILGFIIPETIAVGNVFVYETILVSGVLLLSTPPMFMYFYFHRYSD